MEMANKDSWDLIGMDSWALAEKDSWDLAANNWFGKFINNDIVYRSTCYLF